MPRWKLVEATDLEKDIFYIAEVLTEDVYLYHGVVKRWFECKLYAWIGNAIVYWPSKTGFNLI